MPHSDLSKSEKRISHSLRHNLLMGSLSIGCAVLAFGVISLLMAIILAPSIYRGLRPEMQAIWCNRATTVRLSEICEWKPTPPFKTVPTSNSVPNADPLLLLTPSSRTPFLESQTATPSLVAPTASATPTSASSPTSASTVTALPANTSTATATAMNTAIPIPVAHKLDTTRLRYEQQTWNNCGPATLTMGLSYFGYQNNQNAAAEYLKPESEDKNVSPYQMVNYVNDVVSSTLPVNALYRVGGNLQLIKTLIANNFPVIIQKGMILEEEGWLGHYLLLIGYDDRQQGFFSYDSYLGHENFEGRQDTYRNIDELWRQFNRTFIVMYPPERETELNRLLGNWASPANAIQTALEIAQQEINANQEDNWAWFNLGSSYTLLGNYERAAQAFDYAFSLELPWRTLWYSHYPYQAYYAVGRYSDMMAYIQATQQTTPYVEETFYYEGAVLAVQGKREEAIQKFIEALKYNGNFSAAQMALTAIENGSFTPDLILLTALGSE